MNEEKLTINIPYLERKAEAFNTETCVVEKAIPVSNYRFRQMKSCPMQDYKEISDNLDCMFSENGEYHCLLIYDKENGDGLLVESEGFDYFRYAQYVPQAKLILEEFAKTHAHEMRFCCPLEIYLHVDNYPRECCIADNAEMTKYADVINMGIRENDLPEEQERGLMHWYHPNGENDELENKIFSAHCSVDVIEGELAGVITAKVVGELSDEAMEKFISFCSSCLSDGWGESLEQKYLRTDAGEVNVSFWNDGDDWRLLPEREYLDSLAQSEDMGMGVMT
ncbi:hypothetical protein SAMN02910447_03176 [Ruminococcus sp. YE71]|uniref:DUF6329 domain-containing protein n=1 Tax=unclassified Ruminococcus TaxID=2608920 RepID=UPI000884AB30|nr:MULTISPECIES: DUF6329 domain-containing protein [unclassified Ruminococcus]SDA30345.1 hypothetical protein SAMN02910446_03247 [Ruminococcus sp. YE78]SFW49475.1 hypothetical protein SAMN02910447_03176 [Ruminococcus sp. YE71]